MNRSLTIPAGCCLVAFAALLAAFHGSTGRKAAEAGEYLTAESRVDRPTLPLPPQDRLLSSNEAQQMLTALAGEHLRPWQRWQTSPHRMFSRAAPRPVPSISAEIQLAQQGSQSDSFLLASIVVIKGNQSEPVPCVVDRASRHVLLFAGGQWLTADEWVRRAPLP